MDTKEIIMTLHRGMHQYNQSGRDLNIESYIYALTRWAFEHVTPDELSDLRLLDIGCDYGYSIQAHKSKFKSAVGLEPNKGTRPFPEIDHLIFESPLSLEQLDIHQPMGGEDSFVLMNHVLEHLLRPVDALKMINEHPSIRYFLVAVPDAEKADKDFVYRKSHLSIYTEDWFDITGDHILSNFECVAGKSISLRDEKFEIWRLYRRMM
jgi:hypothetical protein